jgi:hypothetical protein
MLTLFLGTVRGGTQHQGYKSTGRINFAENVGLHLDHKSYVYVTVVASNAAGLHTMVYSDAILVDLMPPEIDFVYDSEMGMFSVTSGPYAISLAYYHSPSRRYRVLNFHIQ